MQDYLTTETGEFLFKDGDFAKADCEAQDMERIINSNKGEWKQFPTLGAALVRHLKSGETMAFIQKEIEVNLKSDGFTKITFTGDNIDATRE